MRTGELRERLGEQTSDGEEEGKVEEARDRGNCVKYWGANERWGEGGKGRIVDVR